MTLQNVGQVALVLQISEEYNMITELCWDIGRIRTQISELQEELLAKERELWWLKRPHILQFDNSEWYTQSDDDGGQYPVFYPCNVVLNPQWLSVAGNQELVDRQLAYIVEVNGDDYDDDRLPDFLICGLSTNIYCEFSDDPYPDFKNAPDTVSNPNYV